VLLRVFCRSRSRRSSPLYTLYRVSIAHLKKFNCPIVVSITRSIQRNVYPSPATKRVKVLSVRLQFQLVVVIHLNPFFCCSRAGDRDGDPLSAKATTAKRLALCYTQYNTFGIIGDEPIHDPQRNLGLAVYYTHHAVQIILVLVKSKTASNKSSLPIVGRHSVVDYRIKLINN
jgi:hypothetical protein